VASGSFGKGAGRHEILIYRRMPLHLNGDNMASPFDSLSLIFPFARAVISGTCKHADLRPLGSSLWCKRDPLLLTLGSFVLRHIWLHSVEVLQVEGLNT
jgi:hypothetical protein